MFACHRRVSLSGLMFMYVMYVRHVCMYRCVHVRLYVVVRHKAATARCGD